MRKVSRETQLQQGERLLKEWGLESLASVEALRAVSGREPAADLAIAARLGAQPEAASVEALRALEAGSHDKLVHNEIRRSRYRLEQRGVTIPQVSVPGVAARPLPQALEGYLSPVDGRGDQLVWLVKPRPEGVAHLFAVINDPDGLREVELSVISRKGLRAARQEMLERHKVRMVEADWHYCDFLIDRAFRWATERANPIRGDYRALRAQLIKDAAIETPPLILGLIDPESVQGDPQLVTESDKLLEEPEFQTWFFDPEAIKSYLEEMRQARDSPLVLNPAQQEERFRALVERAVEELFGTEHRASWVRRLEEMAYFLHATARPDQAKRALAAALALERSSRGGRDIAICEQLARTSLAAFWQMEEQRREEQARSSLVITPQQAARELERRR